MADQAGSTAPESGRAGTRDRTDALLVEAADLLGRIGRSDLADRVSRARTRLHRSQAVVCVVGEFKQGKSALVNAICGAPICPVHDDVATAAPTWLYASQEPEARVRLVDGEERVVEPIPVERVADFIREDGIGAAGRRVELVEIGHPSAVLERGLGIVDMPGSGGVQTGRMSVILGFLPDADALLFATDASAELSASELDFLRQASVQCPTVIVALTKTDLYAHWRTIAELNSSHLADWEIDVAGIIPVSADLRMEALRRGDRDLNAESGVRDLLTALRHEVIDRRADQASRRSLAELSSLLSRLVSAGGAERDALRDPDRAAGRVAELAQARDRVASLRKAGSRWSTVLNDGFTDLIAEQDHVLRTEIRQMLRDADQRLEDGDPAGVWNDLVADIQKQVGDLAAAMTSTTSSRSEEVARSVAAEIGDSAPAHSSVPGADTIDAEALWDGPEDGLSGGPSRPAALLAAVRGGSSGVVMLGIIGSLTGLALASPVALGAGIVFGAKQLTDDRKRQADLRRREGRSIIQQYLRQVQVELSTQSRRMSQEALRALRNHFSERIAELDRTASASAAEIQRAVQQESADRTARITYLDQTLTTLGGLLERVTDLEAPMDGAPT